MKRLILMNPGPINVTPAVRKALLGPDICHREPEFSSLLDGVRQKLLKAFGLSRTHTAAFFTGPGTGALEAMLCAAAEKNKKTLVLSNGVYGDRIRAILELHDIPVIVLKSEIGGFPSLPQIEAVLKKNPAVGSVAMVHHETSTGMLNPLAAVTRLAKRYRKTFFVDAISSLGAEPVDFDGIDFCAGTSGKCLHGFPGVSFVLVSKRAAARLAGQKPKLFSLDLATALYHAERNETAFTPAVQLFYAFDAALDELLNEGAAARIKRYRRLSGLIEAGCEKLGIGFVIDKAHRSHVLTALWTPKGVSYAALHDKLKAAGFVIYAGQSELKGKIFRLANLGDMTPADIRRFFAALEKILRRP